MIELKTLPGGIPRGLELAQNYHLMGDAEAAESICLDVLEVEHDNGIE